MSKPNASHDNIVLKDSNGTAYELFGPADQPALVLIHGLGLCRELWADYIPALSQQYRVLSYDLYGHGNSDPAAVPASMTVYSEQLANLMNDLHIDRAIIAGFSIGGMINRRFAIDHADRVAALLILNSPHDRGSEGQKMVEQRAKTVADQGVLATMDSALKRWFTQEFRDAQPDVLQRVIQWRQRVDTQSYTQAAWVLAAGVKELIQDELPLSAPTLVLTCENDTGSTPAMSASIAAQIKNAEIYIVPKLQHLGLLERPALFIQVMTHFLNKAKI